MNTRIQNAFQIASILSIAAMGILSTTEARADECVGNVVNVEQFRDENLIVQIQGPNSSIFQGIMCGLSGQHGGVSGPTCHAWADLLKMAQISGREVSLWVTDGTSCFNNNFMSTWFDQVQSVKIR